MTDYLFLHRQFEGTVSEFVTAVEEKELKPNAAGKYLTRYYSDILSLLGIRYEYRKTAAARLICLSLPEDNDSNDSNDNRSGNDNQPSLRMKNDSNPSLPLLPSQPS